MYPECLRSDNDTKFTKQEFVTLRDHQSICHDTTHTDSPKNNGMTKRCIAMTLKLALKSLLKIPRLFGCVPLPPVGPL